MPGLLARLHAALLYDHTTGVVVWKKHRWKNRIGTEVGCVQLREDGRSQAGKPKGLRFVFEGREYALHRIIWLMMTGCWPDGWIDHIDGDPLNNRLENLREVTPQESSRNLSIPRHNTSGCVGVQYTSNRHAKKKWRAQVTVDNRQIQRQFSTREEAVAQRRAWEKEYGFHPNHGRKNALENSLKKHD